MTPSTTRMPALRFSQQEQNPMYLAVLPYRSLITKSAAKAGLVKAPTDKLYRVDRWEPWDKAKGGRPEDAFGPKAGYQRREDDNHALDFVLYILGQYERRKSRKADTSDDSDEGTKSPERETDGYDVPEMVPVTGILNTRQKGLLMFSSLMPEGGKGFPSAAGWLEYPDTWVNDAPIFWVVDMQHRLRGIELALKDTTGRFSADQKKFLLDYSLPICITDGLDMFAETELFYTINTAAKRVPTSLAYMLLNVQLFKEAPGRSERLKRRLQIHGTAHRARAALLAYYLNYTPGPWENRIRLPNDDATDDQIISHNSVMSSLSNFMSELGASLTDQEAVQMVNNLWKGIALRVPYEFEHPEGSAIQQGAGVFAFNRYVLNSQAATIGPRATPEDWKVALAGIETLPKFNGQTFWSLDNERGATQYSSGKGFRILAGTIRDHLADKVVRERLENYLASL